MPVCTYVCMRAQGRPSTESLVVYVAVLWVEVGQPCTKRSWLERLIQCFHCRVQIFIHHVKNAFVCCWWCPPSSYV